MFRQRLPWAKYTQQKGAIKLHLLLDHDGYLPSFAVVTEGKYSELNVARDLGLKAGTILAIDRGYNNYVWFGQLTQDGVFFVTRMKTNMVYTTVEVCAVPEKGDVLSDPIVSLGYSLRPGCVVCRVHRFIPERFNSHFILWVPRLSGFFSRLYVRQEVRSSISCWWTSSVVCSVKGMPNRCAYGTVRRPSLDSLDPLPQTP